VTQLNNYNFVNYTDCNGNSGAIVTDPFYWEIGGGTDLFLCACGTPTVGGGGWGGSILTIGTCDCLCTTIEITDQDITDYGQVYMYYQCCDGQFSQAIYGAQTTESRCISRVMYLAVFFRGVWTTIPNAGGTSSFSYGGTCCGGAHGCGCEEFC
jgi:hypothetical protein